MDGAGSKVAGLFVMVAASTAVVSIGWAVSTARGWLILAAVLVSVALVAFSVQVYRRMRRSLVDWGGMHPVVWESRGCVCPWCQVRVDSDPCPGHGFSVEEQPALLAYWEALATRDSSAVMQMADELQSAAQAKPEASMRTAWFFVRPLRAIAPGMFDAERPPLARACAAWPVSLALVALILAVAIALDAAYGRRTAMIPIGGCWIVALFPVIAAVMWSGWKPGPPRCASCGHLCSTAKPTLCPECGADLARRGAVERGAKARSFPWAFALVFPLMWIVPSMLGFVVRALPIGTRNAIYSVTLPPSDYFRTLDPTTMSPADATDTAELMLLLIEREGDAAPFLWDFLPKAIAAGTVPQSYLEKAARVSARPTLAARVDRQTGRVQLEVRANWRGRPLGFYTSMRILTGGFSTDGGRSWSRDWDEARELPRGRHEIRARCWVVVEPVGNRDSTIGFDDQAMPIVTDQTTKAFEVPLSVIVEIP
ncbi:MAG: hypothetical protein RL325_1015 [Planctomycetota bacterium]